MDGLLVLGPNRLLLLTNLEEMRQNHVESFGAAYQKHVLYNGNSSMEIIPERGALLNNLVLDGQVLTDHYTDPEELKTLDWAKSTLLFPFANRLRAGKYLWNGKSYQFPINLAPNAIHGFGMFQAFEVVNVEQLEDTTTINLTYHYDRHFDFYPFRFSIALSYTLSEHALQVTFGAKNEDQQSIPMGLGWHPYFKLGGGVEHWNLKTPNLQEIVIDANMIPTGQKKPYTSFTEGAIIGNAQLDTCFQAVSGQNTQITLSNEAGTLEYWQDSNFKYVQLFIPPSRNCLAIEPMTCNVDAFNQATAEIALEPNQSIGGSFGIKWTKA